MECHHDDESFFDEIGNDDEIESDDDFEMIDTPASQPYTKS
jgi:hypothetical protein